MSDMNIGTGVPPAGLGPPPFPAEHGSAYGPHLAQPEHSAWVGWIVFAATMMLLLGAFHALQGLVALFRDEYFVVTERGLTVEIDYTAWGWTHIVLGAIAVGAAFGLLAGQMWARVVGIAMALISAVVNLAFIEAYPLWSIIVITLDVLVIYAIAMHGKEVKAAGV